MNQLNTYKNEPGKGGRFGDFGGRFVAETLMPLILELDDAYQQAKEDPIFTLKKPLFLKKLISGFT